jgi:hypothetical protein
VSPGAVSPVQEQIDVLTHDLHASAERGLTLLRRTPEEFLWEQPSSGRWSVGECIEHLNISHERMLQAMQAALDSRPPDPPAGPYKLDSKGWLLTKMLAPGFPMRTKTAKDFVPQSGGSRDALLSRFRELLERVWNLARQGTERDFGAVKMESPFRAGLRYTVYSGLVVTEVHLRRHLQQAEAALRKVFPDS